MLNINNYNFRTSFTSEKPIKNEMTPEEELPEDEYDFPKPPVSDKTKNAIIGSLMALSALTLGGLEVMDNDKYDFSGKSPAVSVQEDPYKDIICNPEAIAKGGDDDNIVELQEFMNMLDYASLEGLPESTKKAVKTVVSARINPVFIGKGDDKKKIIEQIQKSQEMLDRYAEEWKFNPPKSPDAILAEYEREFITSSDILYRLDFSELRKYTDSDDLVLASIIGSVPKIRRDDEDAYEKVEQEVEKAQKYIDKKTKEYKAYSKVIGNDDNSASLSTIEFSKLLLPSFDGLTPEQQKTAIRKSLAVYKPIRFMNITSEDEIKEVNKKIGEAIQKSQNVLDAEANKFRYQNFVDEYGIIPEESSEK